MQRIILTALALSVGAISAGAEPLSSDSTLYPPNYTLASLGSAELLGARRPASPPTELAQAPVRRQAVVPPLPPVPYPAVQTAQPSEPEPAQPSAPEVVRPVHNVVAQRRRNLGGGFIEFLLGGADERPRGRPHAVAMPSSVEPLARERDPAAYVARPAPPPVALRPEPAGEEPRPGPIERIYAPTQTSAPTRTSVPTRTASLPPVRPMSAMDPEFLPTVVKYDGPEGPGTVIINTQERFLYHVMEGGHAKRYGIGVGRPGFTWAGTHKVTAKREWPDWYPPEEMLKRQPNLPRFMPGGPENPLGARALYLGSTLYRIHGSNEPWTIGRAVSSGCIRMRNQDVMDLYDHVNVGAKVVVI